MLLWLAGCLSDHPGSSSLAYVDVETPSVDAIQAEIIRVFEADNYTLSDSFGSLVFEREGTQRDRVLFGRYDDERLVMRVVVSLESRRVGGYLVRADVYAVRDGREESLSRLASRSYQNLLNRVKANLATSGGAVQDARPAHP